MEFNSIINRLLQANQQAHERNLHIRTYAVVPLGEQCGIIEWVDSTTSMYGILAKRYEERGINIVAKLPDVKAILAKTSPSPQKIFTNELLPMFRPVMYEWFAMSFPSPERWLMSRAAFTRTAAVMSIVGYILGLGDRHCSNILLDTRSGEVVHVDFDCLFDKGKKLPVPEIVPFRLTQNMVDAMGITGYEGTFRKTCEITLRLLCEHRDALMSVLETLVHDPPVEWTKHQNQPNLLSRSTWDPVNPNDLAKKALARVREKMKGKLDGKTKLSVEAHINELIRRATDPELLFQMYFGWAAYL
ncbi:serine/threonine-protein kinase M1 [Linderina macrospora]|uniref:Serine/threonine-protein kinase M1 n=1 Tax=Linderina macrospora TaxID=4868 RepID=A0ACC1J0H0_9FUNG|nr:serine/threonine-protein kinase M1 [Linderina macrospora]